MIVDIMLSSLWLLINQRDIAAATSPGEEEGIPAVTSTRATAGEEEHESVISLIRPGVITGRKLLDDLQEEFRQRNVKLPVVYCTSHKECNRVLLLLAEQKHHAQQQQQLLVNRNNNNNDAAAAPAFLPVIVIVRCNFGTCAKYQGGSPQSSSTTTEQVAVEGAVAMARYFHEAALYYGVSVILQSETKCWDRLAGWFGNGLLPICKEFYQTYGTPLFSSHIMELSSPSEYHTKEELSAIARRYQEELKSIDMKLNVVGYS